MRILYLFLLLFSWASIGQELPPVTNFNPNEYGAGNQNWMISEGDNKYIYVANNSGLLEFNGEQWSLYEVPGGASVRSVHASSGRIYSGSYMDFGYWERTPLGILNYTSLKDSVNLQILDGEQFWDIMELENYVVFQSHQRLYSFNKKTGKVIAVVTESNISNLFHIGERIFYQVAAKGLFIIENGKSRSFITNDEIQNKAIVGLFSYSENKILAVTRDDGLFVIDGKSWRSFPVENYPVSKSFFSALYLKDGTLALGSIGDGLYFLELGTSKNYHLSQPNILNNTVLAVTEDSAGNIWCGLDNGITHINKKSSFRLFIDTFGDIGTVYCSYKQDENIYLGTNQGLYYSREGYEDPYTLVPGTSGQVWSINNVNGKLYVGHDRGTFLVEGNSAQLIWDGLGTWTVQSIGKGTIQGHYNGLSYLPYENESSDTLTRTRYIKNFDLSSRNIVVENDSVIWIGHYHKGIFRLKLSPDYSIVEKLENFVVSYESGLGLQLFSFNDSIYYSTEDQVYKYLPNENRFTINNRLNPLFSGQNRISGISEVLKDGTWWTYGKDNLYYVTRDPFEQKLTKNSVPLPSQYRNIAEGFENISLVGEKEYLVGSNLGYIKFKLPLSKPSLGELAINKVETALKGENFVLKPLRNSVLELKNEMNFINFYFSVPNYGKLSNTEYSYRIVNYTNNWSRWKTGGMAVFKNLPSGDYIFEVKAKYNQQTTEPVSYPFKISPPWFFSNLALAGYVVLFILMVFGIHYSYKQYLKKALREKEKTLKMQNLEAEQKIIKLQKEHLERDVAEKNRELAASTMSIIKKNEFLTSIKRKLKESDSQRVKGVITTIDKEISEEDNWNLFKEAFKNADKEFFDKIKSKHPELTSNDLRLCAYLRLNLSSKEIAPLINISVKSVEIKRYRLRKKMNLPREINLTDYIMEL